MRQGVYSAPKYLYNYPPQTAKKWSEDIECIIKSNDPDKGSLYLSNVEAAENPATVRKLRVGAILSCAKGYVVSHPTNMVPFYKYIPGEDKETFDISLHFDECVEFIHKALEKTNIIVHCIAGVSRSASMVIAYFMKHYNLSFRDAFSEVKSKRKIISPNDGFIKHLKVYEEKLKFSTSEFMSKELNNERETETYHRTFSRQFYSPAKKYDYGRNYDLTKSTAKNPESGYKEDIYRYAHIPSSPFLNSPTKNTDNIRNYKSVSMTLIPGDNNMSPRMSPRFGDKYGKTLSKELSPRKTINYTSEKPRPLTRDVIYQDKRQQSGYFDSMNEELNMKIEAIRKKYEQQRQELMKNHTPVKINEKEKSIYVDRKGYNMPNSFSEKKDHYKAGRKDIFQMYDKNIDLKLNPRLNNINIDHLYVPRASAGYGFGLGYYGKRYK